jgi:hypothetical protein
VESREFIWISLHTDSDAITEAKAPPKITISRALDLHWT